MHRHSDACSPCQGLPSGWQEVYRRSMQPRCLFLGDEIYAFRSQVSFCLTSCHTKSSSHSYTVTIYSLLWRLEAKLEFSYPRSAHRAGSFHHSTRYLYESILLSTLITTVASKSPHMPSIQSYSRTKLACWATKIDRRSVRYSKHSLVHWLAKIRWYSHDLRKEQPMYTENGGDI